MITTLPRRFRHHWHYPYGRRARHSRAFKKWLWQHGYVTPHFTRNEWRCHDGTPVPKALRKNAQRHGFMLERFRHRLGDKPLRAISFYRTAEYNRRIGGATLSRHVQADASDFSKSTVDGFGSRHFFAVADKLWGNGGVGQYPGGSAHTDSRGYRARWSTF